MSVRCLFAAGVPVLVQRIPLLAHAGMCFGIFSHKPSPQDKVLLWSCATVD